MNRNIPALLFSATFASSALASEHTGYWNQITENGAEFNCESATSKSTMISILRKAGWDVINGIPRINWDQDEVVIVSPSTYYKNGRLVFFGLFRRDGGVVLDYGFKPIEGSESTQANSASFGSVEEGKPATIVISHRRGLDSVLKFTCANRGFIQ